MSAMAAIMNTLTPRTGGEATIASPSDTIPTSSSNTNANSLQFVTDDPRTKLTLAMAIKIRSRAPIAEAVLITGPSGTGKELLARLIHVNRESTPTPFVAVNIAALPDTLVCSTLFGHVKGAFTGATDDMQGLFRAAKGGTVFLDEIGDMPLHQQSALLRVIEQRVVTPVGSSKEFPIDCRIIAATNRIVTDDTIMRLDLYARFMHLLHLTSLLSRPNDAALIAQYYGLSLEGLSSIPADDLERYNVRAIKRAAAKERLNSALY